MQRPGFALRPLLRPNRRAAVRVLAMASAVWLAACEQPNEPADDPCASSSNPMVQLGKGVGGAFTPYEEGEVVGLDVAPQGGFGVTVVITTEGLLAGSGSMADILMEVEIDGETDGSFLLTGAALLCEEDVGGRFDGAVVGFDTNKYSSFDDLLGLDGQRIDLVVTVTDSEGAEATARNSVTLNVGNDG